MSAPPRLGTLIPREHGRPAPSCPATHPGLPWERLRARLSGGVIPQFAACAPAPWGAPAGWGLHKEAASG